eukprot:1917214-Prymnesium_polylepis.1
MDSPFVMMCSQCRQVISDSNQLLSAVSSLDALVLDAVVGVRISEATEHEDGAVFSKLSCSSCEAELGRVYRQTTPAMQHIVHARGSPRYTLFRSALGSYVMGSTKTQHDAAHPADDGSPADEAAAQPAEAVAHAVDSQCGETALPSSTADEMRVQLAQLMRVVLGLDQRLRAVEQQGILAGDSGGVGQKRARR